MFRTTLALLLTSAAAFSPAKPFMVRPVSANTTTIMIAKYILDEFFSILALEIPATSDQSNQKNRKTHRLSHTNSHLKIALQKHNKTKQTGFHDSSQGFLDGR